MYFGFPPIVSPAAARGLLEIIRQLSKDEDVSKAASEAGKAAEQLVDAHVEVFKFAARFMVKIAKSGSLTTGRKHLLTYDPNPAKTLLK